MTSDAAKWLKTHKIDEVECMVPDLTGMARGKILPRDRFLASLKESTLRLPEDIFYQTVTGEYPEPFPGDPTSPDMILRPDISTLRLVPWYDEPTAQVICDCATRAGDPLAVAPRQVLRHVLDLYAEKGWRPVIAPELEFYLVATNTDPDYPLEPPVGRSGRQEAGRQAYGIDAVNEFDPVMDDLYGFCEAAGVGVDTLIHESGPAQLEINFHHGDPLSPRRPGPGLQTRDPRGGAAPQGLCHLHGQTHQGRGRLGHAHPPVRGRHQDGTERVRRRARPRHQTVP